MKLDINTVEVFIIQTKIYNFFQETRSQNNFWESLQIQYSNWNLTEQSYSCWEKLEEKNSVEKRLDENLNQERSSGSENDFISNQNENSPEERVNFIVFLYIFI